MPDNDFESRIYGFERAWQRDEPCEIAEILERRAALTPPERHRLLLELICVDLEYRWRNRSRDGAPDGQAYLEHSAAKFPELGTLDQMPLLLVGEEYRARRRWGDGPTHADFLSRFHARHDEIRAELARIDRELEEESAGAVASSPPPVGLSIAQDPEGRTIDVPLLPYRDFVIRRMISEGRMGKVYQAWQHSTKREIAVKFLRKSLLRQPCLVQRFLGEAKTIARLRHPNIVGVHGLGRTTGDAYFIIMDLIGGPNLALLGEARAIPVEEAIRWSIQICDALEHAHARGVIHCDLKPANILLDGDGVIRVTDFGLARSLTEQLPWTAEVEGTVPFMAPEQASRCWGPIDTRTDIYGIGAVLFTLLTGRPPWVGRRLPDLLAEVIGATPVIPATRLLPNLARPISDLCGRCLSKAPEDRYGSVQELRTALSGLIGVGGNSAPGGDRRHDR